MPRVTKGMIETAYRELECIRGLANESFDGANACYSHHALSASNYIATLVGAGRPIPNWVLHNWAYFKAMGWRGDVQEARPMNRKRPSDNEIRRRIMVRIEADVELYGQSVIFVGDHPPFQYTVGRSKRDLPELLIVLPINPEAGKTVLNELDRLMPQSLPSGSMVSLGGKYPALLIDADIRAQKRYTRLASAMHGDDTYRVQQVILCDPDGRFPTEPGCAGPYAKQPILNRTAEIIRLDRPQ